MSRSRAGFDASPGKKLPRWAWLWLLLAVCVYVEMQILQAWQGPDRSKIPPQSEEQQQHHLRPSQAQQALSVVVPPPPTSPPKLDILEEKPFVPNVPIAVAPPPPPIDPPNLDTDDKPIVPIVAPPPMTPPPRAAENVDTAEAAPAASAHNYAYAILLCDDKMAVATLTLVRSIAKSGTIADIVVCCLPEVSPAVRDAIGELGGRVREFEQIDYPYMKGRSVENLRDNKACRYAKLQMWSMTEYAKVIYLDADMLVLKSLDELFQSPDLSAVPDKYPGVFNSGLMVFEPRLRTMHAMIDSYMTTKSYNKGDQGFLNAFFSRRANSTFLKADEHPEHRTRLSFYPLPSVFNLPIWLKRSAFGGNINMADVFAVHFTAEVKPWSFFWRRHNDFDSMYDATLFYQWIQLAQEMVDLLTEPSREALPEHGQPLPQPLQEVCSAAASKVDKRVNSDAFTVVISTWRGKRVPLGMLVALYRRVPQVHRIVIIWHDPATAPTIASEPSALVPLLVYRVQTNSLNNRFLPLSAIETEGFLTVDDDILASPEDLAFGFSIWKRNPQQLAGPYLRSHVPKKKDGKLEYGYSMKDSMKPKIMHNRVASLKYSMVLTKLLFAPTRLLFMFTCLMPRDIQLYVDSIMNCEDIAFNLFSSVVLRAPPLALDIPTEDWGRDAGISTAGTNAVVVKNQYGKNVTEHVSKHLTSRSECLTHLIGMFKGTTPLENHGVVGSFRVEPNLYVRSSRDEKSMQNQAAETMPLIAAAGASTTKTPSYSLVGRDIDWGDPKLVKTLKRDEIDMCKYCDHFITRVWVYRASPSISNRSGIAGVRVGVDDGSSGLPANKLAKLSSTMNEKSLELLGEWAVDQGHTITSAEVFYSSGGPVSGIRFGDSSGRRSPLFGSSSGKASVTRLQRGLCGVQMVFGNSFLEAVGFMDPENEEATTTTHRRCDTLVGNAREIAKQAPGHVVEHDECFSCDRQMMGMEFWANPGKGSLAAMQVEFGSLFSTDHKKQIHTERRHGKMVAFGCGNVVSDCTYIGSWKVEAPVYFASISVHYTDRVVTGIAIKNSDGHASPLFGAIGTHVKDFSFASGVCGITFAAGASIDALALKSRETIHGKWGLSCNEAFTA